MTRTALDFLIIGAQKAGTTTLFQLLSEHPGVYVPPGKEVPFFNRDGVTLESYGAMLGAHFGAVPDDVLIGKATPHYLSDAVAAETIARVSPSTKLIVILRDPVERAFSHYRMSLRRKIETRSFTDAVSDMLDPADLADARALRTGRANEARTYVVWGEYGRLLERYSAAIDAGRLLVLSTRALEASPEATVATLLDYLGLDHAALPSLGTKAHQGGSKERLPIQRVARAIAPVRWLWRHIPERLRTKLIFRIDQWNVVQTGDTFDTVDPATIATLRAHFAPDTAHMEALTGWSADWPK